MNLKANKIFLRFFSLSILLLGIFFLSSKYLTHPSFNLVSIDLINNMIKFKVTDVKVGDTVLLLKNADNDCNLGSIEAISVANNNTHFINLQKRENEYVYLFRIKVISGKKMTCSSEIAINLFN